MTEDNNAAQAARADAEDRRRLGKLLGCGLAQVVGVILAAGGTFYGHRLLGTDEWTYYLSYLLLPVGFLLIAAGAHYKIRLSARQREIRGFDVLPARRPDVLD